MMSTMYISILTLVLLKLQKMFEIFLKGPIEAQEKGIDMSKISTV